MDIAEYNPISNCLKNITFSVITIASNITIKLPVEQISVLGRVTQGLRLISLRENQFVATISVVDKVAEEIEEEKVESDNIQTNQSREND